MVKRILIVDEDELVREFLSVLLSTNGFAPYEVEDGVAALELLAQQPVDLILMEQMLPRLSGQETLIRLRADSNLSQIPVIFLSQRKRAADIDTTLAIGAMRYVTKPFCSEELLQVIDEVLREARSRTIRRLKVTIFGSAIAAGSLAGGAGAHELAGPSAEPVTVQQQVSETATAPAEVEGPTEGSDPVRDEIYLAVTHTQSDLGGGRQDWSETAAEGTWRPDSRQSYSVSVAYAEQFGLSDTTIQVQGNWRLSQRSDGYVALRATPDADFRDSFGIRAGYGHVVSRNVAVGFDARYGEYAGGPILSLAPRVSVSAAGDRLGLTASYIDLRELDGGNRYDGWSLRLRAAPTDRVSLQAGLARYPEVDTGVARQVAARFVGIGYRITDDVRISAAYANDEYEDLFTRQALTLAISVRLSSGR